MFMRDYITSPIPRTASQTYLAKSCTPELKTKLPAPGFRSLWGKSSTSAGPWNLDKSGSCWDSTNRNKQQCARFPCHLWSNTKAQARTSSLHLVKTAHQVSEQPGSCPTERQSPTRDSPCGNFYFFSLENVFMCLCLFELYIGDLGDQKRASDG